MNQILRFLYVSIFFLILTSLVSTAMARTVFVSPSGVPDGTGASWETAFNTITAGLTVSASGDDIWVHSATYTEAITMKENVGLYGGFTGNETNREERDWVANETVIDASGLQESVVVGADRAVLDGFTVTRGHPDGEDGGGVYCNAASLIIRNCIIAGNDASHSGGGLYCANNSSLTMEGCIIRDNSAVINGGGVCCESESSLNLENCTIVGNSSNVHGGGIYCEYAFHLSLTNCWIAENSSEMGGGVYGFMSSPTLFNCVIANNASDDYGGGACISNGAAGFFNCTIVGNSSYLNGGIFYVGTSSLLITNCILWNESAEIIIYLSEKSAVTYSAIQGGWEGEGNISADPGLVQIWDEASFDIHLLSGSPCINSGIALANIETDFEGDPRPSGEGWDIGADECVGLCEPGEPPSTGRIWYVASGIEGGDGSSWASPLDSIAETLFRATLLDEIWVQGGTYRESICMEQGVALYGGFRGDEENREERDWSVNETVIDATGLNAPVVVGANNALLDGFTLTGGEYSVGGGIACVESSSIFTNCKVIGNRSSGGGGVCFFNSSSSFYNCHIMGNKATEEGGGVLIYYSSPSLYNCLIVGNEATYGGGLSGSEASFPTMVNCTITGNTADSRNGLYCENAVLTNCILSNGGDEIDKQAAREVTLSYCCLEGGWPGEGNIDSDPMFVRPWDGVSGDFRLRPDSPCIDAGTVVPDLTTDLAGNFRVIDIPGVGIEGEGAIDLGAYERRLLDVGDFRGKEFLVYSTLWNRDESAINETDFRIYNTWDDAEIDWKDILNALDIER